MQEGNGPAGGLEATRLVLDHHANVTHSIQTLGEYRNIHIRIVNTRVKVFMVCSCSTFGLKAGPSPYASPESDAHKEDPALAKGERSVFDQRSTQRQNDPTTQGQIDDPSTNGEQMEIALHDGLLQCILEPDPMGEPHWDGKLVGDLRQPPATHSPASVRTWAPVQTPALQPIHLGA